MNGKTMWPAGAKCAVMFTFDFDAETLWLSRDPKNAERPGVLSQGTYGAKVGVPKILEVLDQEGIRATFFVPGWTAERHTSRLEAILRAGHEIGHHGYLHENASPDNPELEEQIIDMGLAALKKTVGVVPKGYRPPSGEMSDNVLRVLERRGFTYVSSKMDDYLPYTYPSADPNRRGLVELPWHWSLDDAVFFLFAINSQRPIVPNSYVLEIWQQEFIETYRWGGLFDLILHPQVIGRPGRLALLRDFIRFVRRYPNVWIDTGSAIADAWLAQS